mmetsp:Transcript_11009/g.15508  ORF Transcript_11009/g.15508 Transcript_11009/m.15508 type:complete len:392 (-) Transcript_11009:317-1492(-)
MTPKDQDQPSSSSTSPTASDSGTASSSWSITPSSSSETETETEATSRENNNQNHHQTTHQNQLEKLWEMDDDAFLDAMGSGPFMSAELPDNVDESEIAIANYRQGLRQQCWSYHDDHDNEELGHHKRRQRSPHGNDEDDYDDDSCFCTTQSISTATTLSKSLSDEYEIDYQEQEEEQVDPKTATVKDSYYDVTVPITSHGLLLMLKPNYAKEAVTFDGYAKQPDGTVGPAEQEQLFRHRGDVILSMEDYTIEGLSFKKTLELLKYLMNTKRQDDDDDDNEKDQPKHDNENATVGMTTPTITFRMMDGTLAGTAPKTTTSTNNSAAHHQKKRPKHHVLSALAPAAASSTLAIAKLKDSPYQFMRLRLRRRFQYVKEAIQTTTSATTLKITSQ